MKNIIILIVSITLSVTKINAQSWHDKIYDDTSRNFNDVRFKYYNYWKNENFSRERNTRWKQFKRWENNNWNKYYKNEN